MTSCVGKDLLIGGAGARRLVRMFGVVACQGEVFGDGELITAIVAGANVARMWSPARVPPGELLRARPHQDRWPCGAALRHDAATRIRT
jgi:hypothetical protein